MGPEMGSGLLPSALAPAMLPGAALVLAVPSPIEEVGTGAKDLPIEDAAGALGKETAIDILSYPPLTSHNPPTPGPRPGIPSATPLHWPSPGPVEAGAPGRSPPAV